MRGTGWANLARIRLSLPNALQVTRVDNKYVTFVRLLALLAKTCPLTVNYLLIIKCTWNGIIVPIFA